jgi:hypothetical protein
VWCVTECSPTLNPPLTRTFATRPGICFDTFSHPYTSSFMNHYGTRVNSPSRSLPISSCRLLAQIRQGLPSEGMASVSSIALHSFRHSNRAISSAQCPMCKKPSTKALYDFSLNNLIEALVPGAKDRDIDRTVTHEDITPSGGAPGFQFGEDDMQTDDEDNSQGNTSDDDQDTRPGGRLIWPCPSCDPNNTTGYVCAHPIPMPSPADQADATEEAGRAVRSPDPHEERVDLLSLDEDQYVPSPPLLNAPHLTTLHSSARRYHHQCQTCDTYFPINLPIGRRCGNCTTTHCGGYSGSPTCIEQAANSPIIRPIDG